MVSKQSSAVRDQNSLVTALRQRLPAEVFRVIRRIGNLAEDKGRVAYIVGGCVRDILLGEENLDLDIVVEGDALALVESLEDKMELDVTRHRRFGTATVALSGGFKIDIASARKESYAYPSCLPTVTLSSIKDDLFRRDFTINTLAVKINRRNLGQLVDLFSGNQDIREKKIRVLHERSFIDDPTRIFRAIRFEQRFNFTIEKHTAGLIRQAVKMGMLKKLSKFRIGNEIILILQEAHPLKSLLRISRLAGLKLLHPLIKLDKTMIKQFRSAQAAIASFSGKPSGQSCDSWLVYFIILTSGLNLTGLKKLTQAFSLTKKDIRKLKSFRQNARGALQAIETKQPLAAHQIYRILCRLSVEEILVLFCRVRSRRAKKRIGLFLNKLSGTRIKLSGKDLKKLMVKPGPRYKEVLQKVLDAKLNGRLQSKADELHYVRRLLRR